MESREQQIDIIIIIDCRRAAPFIVDMDRSIANIFALGVKEIMSKRIDSNNNHGVSIRRSWFRAESWQKNFSS